jgi:glycosyltransferase involved in cell wall biosynthesis
MRAKISVVIPVYNVKAYLQEAIDSIIAQREYFNEVIIIDDGSTDGSAELLIKLYSNLNYVKIIHKINEGQGIARNVGTKQATGDFIYFFDSDDIVEAGLFKMFQEVISDDPDLDLFCFSGKSFLDPNYSVNKGGETKYVALKLYRRNVHDTYKTGEDAFLSLYPLNAFFAGPPFYIFRKSLLDTFGIRFRAIRYEDEEFTFQLFLHAGRTLVTDHVLYKRRVREGSTMQLNRNFKDIIGYIKTIETLEKLKELNHLKLDTIQNIKDKIFTFVKLIIQIKATSNIKFSPQEKKIYRKSLLQYVLKDKRLLFMYNTYSIEYKLRKLKKIFLPVPINKCQK